MAIFELPARVIIEVQDEKDLTAGRRILLTALAEKWLNSCSSLCIREDSLKGNKKVIEVSISVGNC